MKYIIFLLNIQSMISYNNNLFDDMTFKLYEESQKEKKQYEGVRNKICNLKKYIRDSQEYLATEVMEYLQETFKEIELQEKERYTYFDPKEFKRKNILPEYTFPQYQKINADLNEILEEINIISKMELNKEP